MCDCLNTNDNKLHLIKGYKHKQNSQKANVN